MEDPLWRMPLFAPYEKMLDSPVADLNSAPNSPYAGAITAALFLQRFAGPKQPWAHLDLMAWNISSAKAGRPEGGEAMTLRAVFRTIESGIGKAVSVGNSRNRYLLHVCITSRFGIENRTDS